MQMAYHARLGQRLTLYQTKTPRLKSRGIGSRLGRGDVRVQPPDHELILIDVITNGILALIKRLDAC